MPRASSTSASPRASTPYSMPSTQDNTNTIKYKVNCYLRVIHRTSWPTSLKNALKASCFDSDDGRYHCPEYNCKSTFDGKRACDFFRHLASFKKHGDKYAYGPVYHCRGTDEGGALCLFNSTQQSNAKEHIKSVHLKIKTPCPFCPEEFPDAASKSRHVAAAHRDPASTSASPSPAPEGSKKRKSEELDEPASSHRAQKRSKAISFIMQDPVPKLEPQDPAPFALETSFCHSFTDLTLSAGNQYPFTFAHTFPTISAPETHSSSNWITEPIHVSSDIASTSTTPLGLEPSHDAEWNWCSLNATGFSSLAQPSAPPTNLFPTVPQASIYGAEPSYLAIQQSADIFNALYDTSYPTQPLYDPFFDPMSMYPVESTYGWDFNSTSLPQPLTCTPGEYFL